MSDFDRQIKECFLDEAAQMLAEAEQCFLSLESKPDDGEVIDQLFRLAHNLKGSGNAVGFTELGGFTHRLESLLLDVKHKRISVTRPVIDLLLKCSDHLQTWIGKLRADLSAVIESDALLGEIAAAAAGGQAVAPWARAGDDAESAAVSAAPSARLVDEEPSEPGHVPTPQDLAPGAEEQTLDHAAEPGEPLPATEAKGQALSATPSASARAADESIRVSLGRLDKLLNRVSELVILHSVLKEQSSTTSAALRKTIIQLGKATREVQDISMGLRMLPIKPVFQKMQRIVRDTSQELDKLVTLHTEGEDTEVDKTVLEALGDPLVHLVRNAVDHGIESMEGRLDAGKDATGRITLRAFHQCGNLVVELQDDGGGLDAAKLQRIAVKKGLIASSAKLSDKDAYELIFAPGFSTKSEVTSISGRGVGMDVVKTNITALQGTIQIETELGRGTTFRITLPLTLAVIDGMIVRSGGGRYVVPLSHVHETIKPAEHDVHYVTGMGDVFSLRGENLPLYHLDNLLNQKPRNVAVERSTTIVVRGQRQALAVMVDDIVGQAQLVIKKLGSEHRNPRGFSGSAILGDGRPALILELEELGLRAQARQTQPRLVKGAA
jgi:two-component system chemotaxis sensor kinase CheA